VQVVKTFVVPYIKAEGERLQYALEGPLVNNVDKLAAERVKQSMLVGLQDSYSCTLLVLLKEIC
jgi:hypothetical protein